MAEIFEISAIVFLKDLSFVFTKFCENDIIRMLLFDIGNVNKLFFEKRKYYVKKQITGWYQYEYV